VKETTFLIIALAFIMISAKAQKMQIMNIKGFTGISLFGRTDIWKRIK
jgi:uncharacterized protein (DUF2147 family)